MKNLFILLCIGLLAACSSDDGNRTDNSPTAPSDLTGNVVSVYQTELSWTDNSDDEQGFYILRKTTSGAYVAIGTVDAGHTTFTDTDGTHGTTYTYAIQAFGEDGVSLPSNEWSVTHVAAEYRKMVKKVVFHAANAAVTQYDYQYASGKLVSISGSDGSNEAFSYTGAQLTTVTKGNEIHQFHYNGTQLDSIKKTVDGALTRTTKYTYTPEGILTRMSATGLNTADNFYIHIFMSGGNITGGFADVRQHDTAPNLFANLDTAFKLYKLRDDLCPYNVNNQVRYALVGPGGGSFAENRQLTYDADGYPLTILITPVNYPGSYYQTFGPPRSYEIEYENVLIN